MSCSLYVQWSSQRKWETLWYNQAKTFESSSLKNFVDPISVQNQQQILGKERVQIWSYIHPSFYIVFHI